MNDIAPNRIRELREARGWSSDHLAELVGTSGASIRRLESGNQPLTMDWMRKIASVLNVWPSDLIANAMVADLEDEVMLVSPDELGPAVTGLAARGFQFYRLLSDPLNQIGLNEGDLITVETRSDNGSLSLGSIVLARFTRQGHPPALVLRQFVPPGLLTTNRQGTNVAHQMHDGGLQVEVLGVVLR